MNDGCRCGEMADAQDLKSWDLKKSCGFESHHRHQFMALERNANPSAAIMDSPTLQSTPKNGACAGFDGHKKRKGFQGGTIVWLDGAFPAIGSEL